MPADEEKVLGMGSEIEFEGKAYRISAMTYELQAKFVSWLKRQAVMSVKEQRSYLTDEEYESKMDRVDRNMAAGVYGFGGELCLKAAKSMEGLKEMVFLLLSKGYPEVDRAFVDRIFDAKIDEVGRAIKRANDDPLLQKPATTLPAQS